jgi:hypothetical protein
MKLPPAIQPPAPSLLSCLPEALPTALRKRMDGALVTWREAAAARDAAAAEVARLSDIATIALDWSGERILTARAAAEQKAACAALDFVQSARRVALAFGDALPHAERRLEAATEAANAARIEVARALRAADPLANDKAVAGAFEASAEVRAADEAEQAAFGAREAVQKLALRPALQMAGRWCEGYLAVEVQSE